MKIGDRVYVHGHIDEIRKDTVIIRNNGGYFGTIPSEVITGKLPSVQPEKVKCKKCRYVYYDKEFGNYWCNRMSGSFMVEEDGYCKWGK